MSEFHRATKYQSKLRLALMGPSGSGKTYTALAIATALGQRVALIDTERGSASKYADLFEFDVLELESFSPERYIEAIAAAQRAGYDVLVIDSLSHAWSGKDGLLEFVDKEAARSQSSNTFGAWRKATPLHNRLVDAMLQSGLHLIVTMRTKMEYSQEKDEKGKTVIRKVGLQPVQRDGLEYEFDVVGDLDMDNTLIVSKSRCPALTGYMRQRDGAEVAGILQSWLTGAPAPERPAAPVKAPEPANGNGHEPAPAQAWTTDKAVLAKFWAWARQDKGLDDKQVHVALGVQHLREYKGSRQDARVQIESWIEDQMSPANNDGDLFAEVPMPEVAR